VKLSRPIGAWVEKLFEGIAAMDFKNVENDKRKPLSDVF
jgi:hypothetical protein